MHFKLSFFGEFCHPTYSQLKLHISLSTLEYKNKNNIQRHHSRDIAIAFFICQFLDEVCTPKLMEFFIAFGYNFYLL